MRRVWLFLRLGQLILPVISPKKKTIAQFVLFHRLAYCLIYYRQANWQALPVNKVKRPVSNYFLIFKFVLNNSDHLVPFANQTNSLSDLDHTHIHTHHPIHSCSLKLSVILTVYVQPTTNKNAQPKSTLPSLNQPKKQTKTTNSCKTKHVHTPTRITTHLNSNQ